MTTPLEQHALRAIRQRFARLYGDRADRCVRRFAMLCGRYGVGVPAPAEPQGWSEQDAVLITYGDMVQAVGEKPLATLRRFLRDHVGRAFTTLHILPFFPSSSDDGFSVVHFRQVDPQLGDWPHIQDLAADYRLMVDLVLNHVSRQSGWFQDFVADVAPGREFFLTPDAQADLSAVVRPRTHPLLTPVSSRIGMREVWTTFSADQVDLDFGNPDVLFEMLDLLLYYVAQGARVIRLDAVAYLWKKPGTTCIHLPETHEVVKLFRALLDIVAPDVRLITETNVPHEENVSYFGQGDEAHLVYQFSLPPLLLHALTAGTACHLTQWAARLAPPPHGSTFLNFTASHDGIGVRPLQGLLPEADLAGLLDHVTRRGGQVSMKREPDGRESPYELNLTWFDALGSRAQEDSVLHEQRFLASQAIVLALQGIPALYFHTLTATPNDAAGVQRTGQARAINRHKWTEGELLGHLQARESRTGRLFRELKRMLAVRALAAPFHPEAPQRVLALDDRLFAVVRTTRDGRESLLCLTNCTAQPVAGVALPEDILATARKGQDLLGDAAVSLARGLELQPYQTLWIRLPQVA